MIFLKRARSFGSSTFLEIPNCSFSGINTSKRPANEIFVVTRGPLLPIGPFVTCTMISDPTG